MRRRLVTTLAATLLAVVLLPLYMAAHDIPSDIRIQMFVKPEGQTLHLLVRVPLASINDISWPELQPGVLDLSRAETALRQATSTAIVDVIDVYENGRKLEPRVAAVRASIPADRSFDAYDRALAHITAPPRPDETRRVRDAGHCWTRFSSTRLNRTGPTFQSIRMSSGWVSRF